MCRTATNVFEASAGSAAAAREWVRTTAAAWQLPDAEAPALLVSELVTNAVRHAGTPIVARLSVVGGLVQVDVTDEGTHDDAAAVLAWRPQQRSGPTALAESGRGLIIVDAVSADWGVEVRDGTTIWARLPLADSWPYRKACPCPGGERPPEYPAHHGYVLHVPEP